MLRSIAFGAVIALVGTAVVHAQVPGHKQEAGHGAKETGAKETGSEAKSGHGAGAKAEHAHAPVASVSCSPSSVGPQSPRDINAKKGANAVSFQFAKSWQDMHVCNVHFHKNAEHRAKGFMNAADRASGQVCNGNVDAQYLRPLSSHPNGVCGGSKPGDTIEVHFVFTSCSDAKPGPTLGACSTSACKNPSLRVESRVFRLVNIQHHDSSNAPVFKAGAFGKALRFDEFGGSFDASKKLQPVNVPAAPLNSGTVQYQGSTTNTQFDNTAHCSPDHVTWNVAQACAPLDIMSLKRWCEGDNPFREKVGSELKEIEGHGARRLVINPRILSRIQ